MTHPALWRRKMDPGELTICDHGHQLSTRQRTGIWWFCNIMGFVLSKHVNDQCLLRLHDHMYSFMNFMCSKMMGYSKRTMHRIIGHKLSRIGSRSILETSDDTTTLSRYEAFTKFSGKVYSHLQISGSCRQ